MKTVEIMIPYFKQGDDLARHLHDNNNNVIKSFAEYAEQIGYAAFVIEEILDILKKNKKSMSTCEVSADCHFIQLTGDDKITDALIKEEYAQEMDFDDDEGEEGEEDEGKEENPIVQGPKITKIQNN